MNQLSTALFYLHNETIKTRCSRCHTEQTAFDAHGQLVAKLIPINFGTRCVAQVCAGCELAVTRHLDSIWPHFEGLAYVDAAGVLASTRCSGCGQSHGECRNQVHHSWLGFAGAGAPNEQRKCCPDCDHGVAP